MKNRLAHSTDQGLCCDLYLDWKTSEFVIVSKSAAIPEELGRFSVADVLLNYERAIDNPLRSHMLLDSCARANMLHGEADRMADVQRRVTQEFRRRSRAQIESYKWPFKLFVKGPFTGWTMYGGGITDKNPGMATVVTKEPVVPNIIPDVSPDVNIQSMPPLLPWMRRTMLRAYGS